MDESLTGRGPAGLGAAWQGKEFLHRNYLTHGGAWLGEAGPGAAGQGKTRNFYIGTINRFDFDGQKMQKVIECSKQRAS